MKTQQLYPMVLERFEQCYPWYHSYAALEVMYLSEPTTEHWACKEAAFAEFIERLFAP